MTPQDFNIKWRHVELKERSTAQSYFNDLCRPLGIDDPVSSDPIDELLASEHKIAQASGGDGWECRGKHIITF